MELNELILDKNQELQWKETARWIKFEEDVEEETDRWGKPHVASLSFRSLLELRRTLAHGRQRGRGKGIPWIEQSQSAAASSVGRGLAGAGCGCALWVQRLLCLLRHAPSGGLLQVRIVGGAGREEPFGYFAASAWMKKGKGEEGRAGWGGGGFAEKTGSFCQLMRGELR